jgi:hypothetical protein
MAKRFKGEKGFVGLACIGEGGMQTGAFHEGMNIAAVGTGAAGNRRDKQSLRLFHAE